jgi:two-component system, NtrC family, C4-dicarboxylate transport sensor histidine kinase DctB
MRSFRLTGAMVCLVATLAAACAAGFAGARLTRESVHSAMARSAYHEAQIRAALLDSEIARYRLVPLALRDDGDVIAILDGAAGTPDQLNRKFEQLARTMGASAVYLISPQGRAVASSNWRSPQSFVGNDYRFRRYFRDALRTGAAAQFALGTVSHQPGLYLSGRTRRGGVIVVKLDFGQLEAKWARAGGDTLVRDANGVVLVSSRPPWRFTATKPLPERLVASLRQEASLPDGALTPLPDVDGSVERTVSTSFPGWTLTLRRSTGVEEAAAARNAAVGGALGVVALAALLWGMWQRAQLRRRRTLELEDAVARRTVELTREMEERAAGEMRAADLRDQLRQANRLATLGQVTANVAHETAQPVSAIRAYAFSSRTLLERGEIDAAASNLDAITALADRIGLVTEELRGFSRRHEDALRPIALEVVVEGALLMLKEPLRDITVARRGARSSAMVLGSKVRLEQVLVNLLQNAIEALRSVADPRIVIDLVLEPEIVRMIVSDNGLGVDDSMVQRLFTPFATSRAEGLGLGLVISQDIMIELGGALRYVEVEKGACFAMEMVRA